MTIFLEVLGSRTHIICKCVYYVIYVHIYIYNTHTYIYTCIHTWFWIILAYANILADILSTLHEKTSLV